MGFIAAQSSFVSTVWGWSVLFLGLYFILIRRNEINQAGIFAAYMMGLEIVLRMVGANVLWEFGKYSIITFFIFALIIEKGKDLRISILIFIYIMGFIPSILLLPMDQIDEWRQNISFNLSGPLSLFMSYLYFKDRSITKANLSSLFRAISLPLISMITIIVFRMPSIDDLTFGTEANYQMSGGYGPNQVSSALGLIITLIALGKILRFSIFGKDIVDYIMLMVCSTISLLTFARGGFLTSILSIFSTWLITLNNRSRRQYRFGAFFFFLMILIITWNIISDFTSGKISDRYSGIINFNQNGELINESNRIKIMTIDLEIFWDNFLVGVGPGRATEMRADYGYVHTVAAHSEFTRALAEHGVFGALGVLCLFFLSYGQYAICKNHNKYITVCFTIMAILTMLHSAMRLSMPGFIFGLAFLRIIDIEKPSLPYPIKH